MITSPAFAGKRYAVLGLARSGVATVEALVASGADVVAWDANEAARAQVSVPLADPLETDLAGFDAVIVSPGVPLNRHPIAARAASFGVPVIGDIELFAQARASLPPHRVVGITGTNGKSTTTALVRHICETAGLPTLMGGNIGLPILSRDPLTPNEQGAGVYVLELSSYQIDLTRSLDCDVAVLLNITPDHLDRYDGFDAYAASKLRLFAMQSDTHVGVMNWHTELGKKIRSRLHGQDKDLAAISPTTNPDSPYDIWGAFDADGRTGSRDHLSVQGDWPNLQGPHNFQNAVAAILAAAALGIREDIVSDALKTFAGLPHRMERVAERNGVLFINDSKATNADSAAPALMAYPAIHWILGGLAKTDDLDACRPGFGHVRAAYTIGSSAGLFAGLLHGQVPVVTEIGTLEAAVRAAAQAARPGETVLLSPACASFDQFRDFEARGDAFRAAVEAL